jgi:hypothetical protein
MRLLAVLLSVLLGLACASSPGRDPKFELTQQEWSEIGTLGIMPGSEPTEVVLWALDAKLGAIVGVRRAVEVANMLTMGLWPLVFYGAGLVCVPALGASIGAAVGAIRKPEHEELEATRQVLFDTIAPACLPQVIQDDLLDAAVAHSAARRIVSLDAIEGRTATDRVSSLRDRGIDAVLEVTLEMIEVSGRWGTNPDGALRILGRYQIISTDDGSIILEGSQVETVQRSLIKGWWEEPDTENPDPTARLREHLLLATKAMATTIAEDVFLKHPFVYPRPDLIHTPAEETESEQSQIPASTSPESE